MLVGEAGLDFDKASADTATDESFDSEGHLAVFTRLASGEARFKDSLAFFGELLLLQEAQIIFAP